MPWHPCKLILCNKTVINYENQEGKKRNQVTKDYLQPHNQRTRRKKKKRKMKVEMKESLHRYRLPDRDEIGHTHMVVFLIGMHI